MDRHFSPGVTRARSPGGQGQCLLVGDSTLEGFRLASSLALRGYSVSIVRTRGEATEIAMARPPRLVITEWSLEGDTAESLIRDVASVARDARVIVTTSCASIGCALMAIRAGATDYLIKPVGVSEILACCGDEVVTDGLDVDCLNLDEAKREYIQQVFARCSSVSETARVLGLDRRSLRRIMVRLQLRAAGPQKPRVPAKSAAPPARRSVV
jgi:two-component system response regulator RegA